MYDITFCPGGECPLRNRCQRFRVIAEGRQDWFVTPPYDPRTGTCGHFLDLAALAPTEERIRTRAYHRWLAGGRRDGRAEADWHEARAELWNAFEQSLRPPEEPQGPGDPA